MSKKYLITYRLNANNNRRINLWIENPLSGYEDIEKIESFLNEHHVGMGDIIAPEGCKIFAFSQYDVPNDDPFVDNDQALYLGKDSDYPEILNQDITTKKSSKVKPKLTLIRGNAPTKEDN